MAQHERVQALVEGHVQGVGFRWYTLKQARHLGLHGWVRNCPDGTVELVAEGSRAQLEVLLERVRQGPAYSRVRAVHSQWHLATGEFHEFTVTG